MRVAPTPAETPRSRLSAEPLVLTVVSLAWMALVLGAYYRQLWAIVAAGPDTWDIPELGQNLRHTGLPFAREALWRTGAAIGAWGVLIAAIHGAGRLLDARLIPSGLTGAERVAARFANGAVVWSLLFLLLAGIGAYRPLVVSSVLAMAALLSIAAALRLARSIDFRGAARVFRQSGTGVRVWQLATIAACGIAFLTALAPEIEYDALYYHLELPRRWLGAGRPIDDITQYISLYPLGWELLFGGAIALDGSPAARLLHWTALAACATVAGAYGARLGLRSRWMAAALFATAPTVLWEGTTAYVDLALALHASIGAGALWMSTRDGDRRWLWLAGVHLGMACATKHLGLAIAAIAMVLYIVRATHASPGQRRYASPASVLLLVGALTLALPLPWYVRAWSASGNPVFPELYAVFGAQPPERWDDVAERGLTGYKARFGRERTLSNIASLPWDATMHAWRYGGTLGPFPLLLVPALIVVCRRSNAARWLAAGAVLYAAVWASPISSYQMRFMVPWWLFVAPLVALAADALLHAGARAGGPVRAALSGVLAGAVVLNLPPFTPLHEGDRVGWTGWLTHVVYRPPIEVIAGGISDDRWLREQVRSYGAWAYLNEHAEPDARVLTFFGGDHFYSRRARLWSEAVVARPVTWGAKGESEDDTGRARDLIARLRSLGITHVIAPAPQHQSDAHKRLTILRESTLAAAFDRIYDDYWTVVYRLRAG